MGELKLAIRSLARRPSFTLAAIGTLALGIAASTAVFSTVNAALLRPLPFPDPGNIYALRTTITDGRYTSGLVGPAELLDLVASTDDIVAGALAMRIRETLQTPGGAVQATAYGVSRDFFDLFGARMAHGRAFVPDEHAFRPGPPPALVLSHRAWLRYFGGDPAVVGRNIDFGPAKVALVGVAAPEFDFPAGTDFWFSMAIRPDDVSHLFDAWIRLAPGTGIDAIAAPMAGVMADLEVRYPDQNKNRVFIATPLLTSIVGDLGPVLLILFAATGLLLLIAAVNVANLMLTRAAGRRREMAIRTALGASRLRLTRQLLTEASVLALAGGILGAVLAFAAVNVLGALGASGLPRLNGLVFDGNVLAFAAAAVALTALAVGAAPALLATRTDVAFAMDEGGRAGTGGRASRLMLIGLIVAEVAVSVALVSGAGRLVLSFEHLATEERGFTSEPRVIADVNLPFPRYREPARIEAWLDDAATRLGTHGVTRIATISSLPLRAELDPTTFVDLVRDPSPNPHDRPNARRRQASAAFFDVMGIPIVAGRGFTRDDRQGTQPVAIVSQAFAERFLQGRDPLREQITIPGIHARVIDRQWHHAPIQIVGVAADARFAGLGDEPEQTVYLAQAQVPARRFSVVGVPEGRDAEVLAPAVREALAGIDALVPVETTTLARVVDASIERERLGMLLMSAFGIAAIVLAAVGVFGVIAFAVSQRTTEMAVRLALGASTRQVFAMVMRQGGSIVLAGGALGLVLAWWTGGAMTAYVYQVATLDLTVLGGSVLAVGAVAIGATALLARRASRVDPALALRSGT